MASWSVNGPILEASEVDFGAFRLRFWRIWKSFSNVLGIINAATNAKKRQKLAKQQFNHKWLDRQGWVGGGDSSRGVLMKALQKLPLRIAVPEKYC